MTTKLSKEDELILQGIVLGASEMADNLSENTKKNREIVATVGHKILHQYFNNEELPENNDNIWWEKVRDWEEKRKALMKEREKRISP